jgi:ribonuclease III
MNTDDDGAIKALEQRIGYQFTNREFLLTALTHASATGDFGAPVRATYQRLEFLGDRVLGLVIAEMLLEAFPRSAEGELAQRLTGLVRNESCAEVAIDLDLGQAIRLGGGEAQSGGRHKAAILGDVCEAVLGAIHLDGGIEEARRFIATNWRERMLNWRGPLRDAKTTLQEWAQARGRPTPNYSIFDQRGPDHAPVFVIEVAVNKAAPERGEGRSRREAEQAAAAALLRREGVWRSEDNGR